MNKRRRYKAKRKRRAVQIMQDVVAMQRTLIENAEFMPHAIIANGKTINYMLGGGNYDEHTLYICTRHGITVYEA